MDRQQVQEIQSTLDGERMLFPYFRDRYALMLLSDFVGQGMSVSKVRRSRFGRLLEKPLIKSVLARCGGRITQNLLASLWPEQPEVYVITLGSWGDSTKNWSRTYEQTCRRGFNLVIQLNFSMKHDRLFRALSEEGVTLNSDGHPVNDRERFTLAWARVDVDLDDEEALIEEVQSDWARCAQNEIDHDWKRIYANRRCRLIDFEGTLHAERSLLRAYELLWKEHARIWDQAVLAAAISFLRRELAVERIFYHTYESEFHMKDFDECWHPPRSLYSRLPRRFCFERTEEAPDFVRRDADGYASYQLNRRGLEWFLLES